MGWRWTLATVLLCCGCGRRAAAPELPAVATERFAPAVREAIGKALEAAQSGPGDAGATGRLGMVLHAHQQYGPAAACYRRAEWMAPREPRWPYYLGVVEVEQGNASAAEAALRDRKSTRLNSSHIQKSRMPSSA